MTKFDWIQERAPRWDNHKKKIVAGAPEGIFDQTYTALGDGEPAPGDWWRVEKSGEVVGYGWLDVVWGDAEILVATSEEARGQGVGTFALDQLAQEAAQRGLNYVCNIVRDEHPKREVVTKWLQNRGFSPTGDGRLSKRVKVV